MLTSHSLIFLAFVSAVPRVAFPQTQSVNAKSSEPTVDKSDKTSNNERLFKTMFVASRRKHLKAVKDIREMNNYEKQYKMVKILAENSLNIIEAGRVIIEGGKFKIGDSEALKNITIQNALSTILENSALFGDVVLQLPNITRRIIKSQEKWNSTIQWALKFVNETQHLLDKPTITMFHQVRQELKIIVRDPTYTNPYWTQNIKDKIFDKNGKKLKKFSKEAKKHRGPRLVNIEL